MRSLYLYVSRCCFEIEEDIHKPRRVFGGFTHKFARTRLKCPTDRVVMFGGWLVGDLVRMWFVRLVAVSHPPYALRENKTEREKTVEKHIFYTFNGLL